MNQPTRRRAGFTLIELMLAMTFISVLLLTIALTIIQMSTIYNRGMTLKEVNQSARDISDDMRRVIASAELFSVPTSVSAADTSDYIRVRSADKSVTYGGRLCTGAYTYVWNTSKGIELNTAQVALYYNAGTRVPARFLKVADAGKRYCQTNPDGTPTFDDVTDADAQTAVELLQAGDRKLGVQSLYVTTSDAVYDATASQRLYTVSLTLGSGATSAMNADQSGCLAPGDASGNANLTYCNVQNFTLVLRAGNAVN